MTSYISGKTRTKEELSNALIQVLKSFGVVLVSLEKIHSLEKEKLQKVPEVTLALLDDANKVLKQCDHDIEILHAAFLFSSNRDNAIYENIKLAIELKTNVECLIQTCSCLFRTANELLEKESQNNK